MFLDGDKMNQEKIGKFIAKLRKQKKLTQEWTEPQKLDSLLIVSN